MAKARTAAQRAALKKAQRVSANKRRGKGKRKRKGANVKRTSGRAFQAGLAYGLSSKLNKRAGFGGKSGKFRYRKDGQADGRHRLRHKGKRRAASFGAGVFVTGATIAVGTAGLSHYNTKQRNKRGGRSAYRTRR